VNFFLTVEEVAAQKGCSVQAVRAALREGRLKGRRFGRSWAVEEAQAEQWNPRNYPRK